MAERTCTADACTRSDIVGRGLCRMHYMRWNRSNPGVPASDRAARPTVCSVEGCEARINSRGWCKPHYRRWQKHGDPLGVAWPWRGQPCTVEGCGNPNDQMGLCKMHAWRMRVRGAPGGAAPEKSFGVIPHGTLAGYKRKCRCDECREAHRLAGLDWRAANRQSVRDRQARYREANRERVNSYGRKWARANPDKVRGWDPARAAAPFDATALAYAEILRNDPCVYCGAPSTDIDHIVPISVSRSSHWTNLAAACDSCNSSKSAKSLLAYLMYRQRRAA